MRLFISRLRQRTAVQVRPRQGMAAIGLVLMMLAPVVVALISNEAIARPRFGPKPSGLSTGNTPAVVPPVATPAPAVPPAPAPAATRRFGAPQPVPPAPLPSPTPTPIPGATPAPGSTPGPIPVTPIVPGGTLPRVSVGTAVAFNCNESEAVIRSRGGPSVTFGTTTLYIGYQQVTSLNQDPRLIRFDNGVRTWCRSDYEVTNDDGKGYGLVWDGGGNLYGVFSSTGTQGTPNQDFRRFAAGGWLTSYGQGGGPRVAIIARIDPTNGNVLNASFLSARLSNGNSNTVVVTNLTWLGNALVVDANSFFSPRRPDRSAMTCSGSSPFPYTVWFTPNLSTVTSASAVGCF